MRVEQDDSTRKVIMTLLKTRGEQSVNDLSQALGITEMAVRRHLNTLERDGFVSSVLVRQAMGRPSNLYSLTSHADEWFPKNYHTLTLDLLEELDAEADGEALVGRLFEGRRDKLKKKYAERMEGKNLRERVRELTAIQNAAGYMAEWEENGDGYVLKEYNCPIAQVANRYQQACKCELSLFQTLLQVKVDRTECLAKNGRKCVYLIRS